MNALVTHEGHDELVQYQRARNLTLILAEHMRVAALKRIAESFARIAAQEAA
jgi:hypothetical protein